MSWNEGGDHWEAVFSEWAQILCWRHKAVSGILLMWRSEVWCWFSKAAEGKRCKIRRDCAGPIHLRDSWFSLHGDMRTLLKGASSNNPQMPEYVIHGAPATQRQLIFLIGNSPGIIILFSLLLGYINTSAIMTGSCFEPFRIQRG